MGPPCEGEAVLGGRRVAGARGHEPRPVARLGEEMRRAAAVVLRRAA
jgi:hypothetical protein